MCLDENGHWTLIGAVSWGSNVCDGPTVLSKVSSFVDWIHETMDTNEGNI